MFHRLLARKVLIDELIYAEYNVACHLQLVTLRDCWTCMLLDTLVTLEPSWLSVV